MSQIPEIADKAQAQVEGRLYSLGTALVLLEHNRLRIEQAIQRGQVGDLLTPTLEDLDYLTKLISYAQEGYRVMFEKGEREGWKGLGG